MNSLDKSQLQKELQKKQMRPGSTQNSSGTQNAGIYATRSWWWQLFRYNFTPRAYPSSFFSPVSFFHLLTLPYSPSPSYDFFCLLLFLLSRSVWGTLRWSCLCDRRYFLLFHIFTFSEEYRLAHHLYTVFSILGHGGFRQVTLMAVNGICSAKVLCKPSLFKRVNFFRSTDRPG